MDTYQIVTDRIIAELKTGTIPWKKPWASVSRGAFNRISGRSYSLTNQILLKHDGEYASYAQWEHLGGHVRKGETAEIVVFWRFPEAEESEETPFEDVDCDTANTSEKKERQRPILKYHRIFHISQVDGVKPLERKISLYDTQPIEAAQQVFNAYVQREGIHVEEEPSDEAYYAPLRDMIHLPSIAQFAKAEEYYSAAFHEATHSTGSVKRLNRFAEGSMQFGSGVYSREELIAEIGSACVLHTLGIETEPSFRNSAAYIQGWLSALKGDKRLVIGAAAQAEKAVKFMLAASAM